MAPTATTANAATEHGCGKSTYVHSHPPRHPGARLAVPVSVAVHGRNTKVVCTNLPRAGYFHIRGDLSSPTVATAAEAMPCSSGCFLKVERE